MKECIICRQQRSKFPDEHVIPKAIGGHYCINSVCEGCNTKMGRLIDYRMTDHAFIKFQRFLLDIEAKKQSSVNPFDGTHTLTNQPAEKVQVRIDDNGELKPYLLPKVPRIQPGAPVGEFTIVLDKRDADNIDTIIAKICVRNGIPRDKIKLKNVEYDKTIPMIHAQIAIDMRLFKMAMLKIAYEFTVDIIPSYFNDPRATSISAILEDANSVKLDELSLFIGSGFDTEVLGTFAHFVDFEKGNHYLILIDMKEGGLFCFVNLFNVMAIGIAMAEKGGYMDNGVIFGVNDLVDKTFKRYTLSEILTTIYSPIELRFQYLLGSDAELKLFGKICNAKNFDYYRINDKIPLFDRAGNVAYDDVSMKIKQPQLKRIDKGDVVNSIITEIELDEELYIALLPSMHRFRIVRIRTEQFKRRKI